MTKKRTIQSSVSRKEGRRQVALGTWCVDLAHNGAEERPHNLDAAAALQAAVGKDLVGVECTPPTILSAESCWLESCTEVGGRGGSVVRVSLAEDLSFVPSTHTRQLTANLVSSVVK